MTMLAFKSVDGSVVDSDTATNRLRLLRTVAANPSI